MSTAPSRTTTPIRRWPKNLEQLIAEVAREKADLGIAFDGDGDRIGVVDDDGHILFGDQLLIVLARDVLKSQAGRDDHRRRQGVARCCSTRWPRPAASR